MSFWTSWTTLTRQCCPRFVGAIEKHLMEEHFEVNGETCPMFLVGRDDSLLFIAAWDSDSGMIIKHWRDDSDIPPDEVESSGS